MKLKLPTVNLKLQTYNFKLPTLKLKLPKPRSKKELPPDSLCRNCHTPLIDRYCHHCGQDFFAGSEKTLVEILYNAVDTIFAWDNKIFNTLKYLIFYPGKLTKEFFNGRITPYVYPAKLFWFIILLFFACINIDGGIDRIVNEIENETIQVSMNQKPDPTPGDAVADKPEENTESTTENVAESDETNKRVLTKSEREKIILGLRKNFVNYIPYVILLLVPFFAFLLYLFFYKKKKYYASHTVFALHFHSFVFLFYTFCYLIKDFIPDSWETVSDIILLFLPVVYFAIALYVAYRPSIYKLIWKIPLIMLLYFTACIAALVIFTIIVAKMVEMTHGINIWEGLDFSQTQSE